MSVDAVLHRRTYDQFAGPDLDPEKWAVLPIFLPDGSVRPAAEPSAVTVVGDGILTVSVGRFQTSHDSFQQADNTKHVLVSAEQFDLPRYGVASFTISQAVTRLGSRRPDDLMYALAAFNVIDPVRGLVFDVVSNGVEAFAVHEQLDGIAAPAGPPFTYLVRAPFSRVAVQPGVHHDCKIEFDTRAASVRWAVNGVEIYRVAGAQLPERVVMGLGLMSGVLLRDGRSVSLEGQGLRSSWSAPAATITKY